MRMLAQGGPGRGVAARLGACATVSLVASSPIWTPLFAGRASVYGSSAPAAALMFWLSTFLVSLVITAPFAAIGVNLARGMEWRRGWADTLFPAAVSFVLSTLLWGLNQGTGPLLLPFILAALGAVGGLTYWLAAGRPG